MRRVNAVLAMGITALFFVHAVMGGFQLMGLMSGGNTVMKVLAWVMMISIVLHMLIGIKLTADTVIAIKRSGASYFGENKLFWIRRISGLALMLFIVTHLMIFSNSGTPVRLGFFGTAQLISQILLAVTLALHIITNIRPLMTALGLRGFRELLLDVMLVTAVLLLFAGAAFVVYFIRWQ